MSVIIRVVIVMVCAYAGSVFGSIQFAELPGSYQMEQKQSPNAALFCELC